MRRTCICLSAVYTDFGVSGDIASRQLMVCCCSSSFDNILLFLECKKPRLVRIEMNG